MELLRADPKRSARELSERLGVTSRQVERMLADLKREGRLKRVGPAKNGHWEIIE